MNEADEFKLSELKKSVDKLNKKLEMSNIYLQEFKEELAAMTMDELIRKYEFNTDRADVIVPALSIYEKIMKYMDGELKEEMEVGMVMKVI